MNVGICRESRTDAREAYTKRAAGFQARVDALEAASARLSLARMAAFIAVATSLVSSWHSGADGWNWAWTAALASVVSFAVLVVLHAMVLRKKSRAAQRRRINEESLCRLERDWQGLPAASAPPVEGSSDVSIDLDLTGDASVYRLLGTPGTPRGKELLARWLVTPSEPDEVLRRQALVAELADDLGFRQELQALGGELGERGDDAEPLVRWAESPSWLLERPWILWGARASALLAVSLAGAQALNLTPKPFWVLPLAVNGVMTLLCLRRLSAVIDTVGVRAHRFGAYSNLLRHVAERRFGPGSPRVGRGLMEADEPSAWREMRRLERLVGWSELRLSPAIHLVVQVFTMWDFHVVAALERWRHEAGSRVRGWLDGLGEVEALCALSILRHDHPSWTFPELRAGAPVGLEATGLGHPLQQPGRCVVNDVELGGGSRFLLVTGSNMSGKSTLLRSIGVNVALAQAGAPVFAERMRLSPLVLGTSFRISDSLERGVSFFMAELQRLKIVVDRAQGESASGSATLLFLLDEILLGTNIMERRVAVRSILISLLELGAIGAISSHDITLAEEGGLDRMGRMVHFTESYVDAPGGPQMIFDYKLRPGTATSVNALELLRMIGLEVREGLAPQKDDGPARLSASRRPQQVEP